MKKQSLIIALLAAAGFMGTSAFAADGTVNITGELTAVTCSVHGGTPGATTGDVDVTLPPIPAAKLDVAGKTAGSTGYKIYVGATGETGCADGTHASVHYEASSPAIDSVTGNLKNNTPVATGGADLVQVQISDASATPTAPINLFTNTNSTPVVVSGNTAELPFTAQYISTGAAKVGTVDTAVQYSVVLN
ncbi:fimbrial protein [Collimonas sp. NPDC087041]|uniref:fimbrial protein n=1 Tax=Collimonas sp. NPDC087041 TaxID=3363960 RepID=UPI003824805E